MGKYTELARDIIKNVGGEENVISLTHCITRLRFQLKDESRANDKVLNESKGVVTVMKSGGQYQVVIGNHVSAVYEEVCQVANIGNGEVVEVKKSWFNTLIDIISGCFQPFLGPLCAGGILKGLNALFIFLGWYTNTDGMYLMLNAIGDALFYFIPVVIGYTAAAKFKVDKFIGISLGAALCYPAIQAGAVSVAEPLGILFGGTILESPYYLKILGIPWITNDYVSSVVPIILVVWLASHVQKLAKKYIPEVIQTFFVPLVVMLVSLIVGFLVIGPITTMATALLGAGFKVLYAFSSVLMGVLVGFFWQVLVIFGLHWSIIPLAMINLGMYGYDTILAGSFGASFAQTAVVAAMYFKLKNKKTKELCLPAIISGICGVTEPAIYGITLPKKKPFIYSMIGGAIGGGIIVGLKTKAYVMGGLGVFGLVNFIDTVNNDASGMLYAFIGIVVSALVGFLLTFFFWKDDSEQEQEVKETVITTRQSIQLEAPIEGRIIPLDQLEDAAFASGALGQGVAIEPAKGVVTAPADGVLSALFHTRHALGITTDSGLEVLIHVGMDTTMLEGKGFIAKAEAGDKIKKGQVLLEFDMDYIKSEGYSLVTPVLISNMSSEDVLSIQAGDRVAMGSNLMSVEKH
ncbi:MAG: beta-glucoside-specific PTS transporter subunit IIABC [Lachnospiraceae bacterium]